MSRAQAISNSLHADESRFLLDPGRADTYSLAYLDKSQTVLYVASGNLGEYDTALSAAMKAYRANPRAVGFLGFYGDEARAHPGPAVTAVLSRFQQFQADDQRIRQLAKAGHDRQAAMLLTGGTAGSRATTSINTIRQSSPSSASTAGPSIRRSAPAIRSSGGPFSGTGRACCRSRPSAPPFSSLPASGHGWRSTGETGARRRRAAGSARRWWPSPLACRWLRARPAVRRLSWASRRCGSG